MKRLFLLLLIMILPLCMACSKPYDFEGPYLTKEIYLTNSPYGGLLGRRIKIDKRTLYIDFNEIGKLKRVNLLYDKDGREGAKRLAEFYYSKSYLAAKLFISTKVYHTSYKKSNISYEYYIYINKLGIFFHEIIIGPDENYPIHDFLMMQNKVSLLMINVLDDESHKISLSGVREIGEKVYLKELGLKDNQVFIDLNTLNIYDDSFVIMDHTLLEVYNNGVNKSALRECLYMHTPIKFKKYQYDLNELKDENGEYINDRLYIKNKKIEYYFSKNDNDRLYLSQVRIHEPLFGISYEDDKDRLDKLFGNSRHESEYITVRYDSSTKTYSLFFKYFTCDYNYDFWKTT